MFSYLTLLPLYEEFARVALSHTVIYYYDWVLAIFINADTGVKGVQRGDHEINQ